MVYCLLYYNGSLKTDSQQVGLVSITRKLTSSTRVLCSSNNLDPSRHNKFANPNKVCPYSDEKSRSNAKKYSKRTTTAEACFTWSTSEGNPYAC